jgi:hypothetical protein
VKKSHGLKKELIQYTIFEELSATELTPTQYSQCILIRIFLKKLCQTNPYFIKKTGYRITGTVSNIKQLFHVHVPRGTVAISYGMFSNRTFNYPLVS